MKWEYKIDFQILDFDAVERYLNNLGEQGWEIIHFNMTKGINRNNYHVNIAAKRQKP